ncbi:arsenate reductase [hydrocarbon metagenome]|uniref:Arsenate reductase n=1 Tax=hydrocarbon metagenome TaxID=938273 RepID=A0A0W8FWT0_9ZZZZ
MPKYNLTVYEKPTCTTCRKLAKKLIENGIDFEKVNYYIEPFTKKQLKSLLKKMEMIPSELIRKKGDAYKKLDMKNNSYSQDQLLDFMIKYPDLVERPIVERGAKAILARPIDKVDQLF